MGWGSGSSKKNTKNDVSNGRFRKDNNEKVAAQKAKVEAGRCRKCDPARGQYCMKHVWIGNLDF